MSGNDNTFKATSKLLDVLFKDSKFQDVLVSKRISWKFNLGRSPWWGGFFEGMVQSVKHCAKKVLGNAKLTFDELSTVLAEIECTLNSRPLTYSYEEPEEQVLTTSHLILGYTLSSLSENFHQEISSDYEENLCDKLSNRFIHLTRRLEYFWNG